MESELQDNGSEPGYGYGTQTRYFIPYYQNLSALSAMPNFDSDIDQNYPSDSQNMQTNYSNPVTNGPNMTHQMHTIAPYAPLRLDCEFTHDSFMDNSHWNGLTGLYSPWANSPPFSQSLDSLLPEQSSTPGSFPSPSPNTPFPLDGIYDARRSNSSLFAFFPISFDTSASDSMSEVVIPLRQDTSSTGQDHVIISGTPSSLLSPYDLALIDRSFPSSTVDHYQKRIALTEVMQSDWKRQNAFEPSDMDLLQFMRRDAEGKRWVCTFWQDNRPCRCSCRKKDHAKGHIRNHIGHRPFACQGLCPIANLQCDKRYPAVEPLNKHQRGGIKCPQCGIRVLRGNLSRHQASAACEG